MILGSPNCKKPSVVLVLVLVLVVVVIVVAVVVCGLWMFVVCVSRSCG